MKSKEKPNYGIIAIKEFSIIGVIGITGIIIFIIGLSQHTILKYLLIIPGGITGVIGIYLPLSYIFLRPFIFSDNPERDFILWAVKEGEIKEDARILDIGCGTGAVTIKIAKHLTTGKVIGIDFFKGMSGNSPDIAKRNAELEGVINKIDIQNGNALNLPFGDNSFDIVTMGSVLHEMHTDEKVKKSLNEAKRVLKPGGKFITVELLRNARMFIFLLLLSFVWKPKEYWHMCIKSVDFNIIKEKVIKGPIDMCFYIAQKNKGCK